MVKAHRLHQIFLLHLWWYPIAGAIRNVALFGNSVIGSNTYVAFLLNNAKNMNYYSNYETDRLIIGTNQNLPVQGLLAVMCINNT